MDTGISRFTVFFEDPFWVCVCQREQNGLLEVCKITFGAEPRDYEVLAWLEGHFRALCFSPPVRGSLGEARKNPKRARRAAQAELEHRGVGTKAQQALQLQRESGKQASREDRRRRDEAEEERQFLLRREKKKAKHKGR